MLLLSKKDIQRVFSMKDAIAADIVALQIEAEKRSVVPLRTVIPTEQGAFLFMPAYVEELSVASLKNVNIFAGNHALGLPTAPAQILLIDGKTGMISALLDGAYITQLRTGASTGAAFDLLGKKDAKIGGIIGTGSQAETQVEAMLTVRELDYVKIYDTDSHRATAFLERLNDRFKNGKTHFIQAATPEECVTDADLIVTVTPSLTPVFDGDHVKPGATISAVGSYQHQMQELCPKALVRSSKIYFDSQEAVLEESGDLLIPMEQGLISESDFTGNLGDAIAGRLVGRENDEEIIVYKNVGFGTLDLVTAKGVYEQAVRMGIGTNWE